MIECIRKEYEYYNRFNKCLELINEKVKADRSFIEELEALVISA